jgi:ornithine cyclodeaminase
MTEALPFLDADAIRSAVPIVDMVDAVEAAYRDVAAERDRSPLRSHAPLGTGTLLLMPGLRADGRGATVKIVTVMPDNPGRGLPTIHALVVWLEAETGRPLALMDGATVTAMRTGAASGVSARLLARRDAETLAVIGTGAQASWQLRSVLAVRPIRRVLVYSREPEKRSAFARAMSAETGTDVVAVDSAEAAVRDADVVCCATTSGEPVFDPAWIRPGTHVSGVGSFRLDMRELPPELFARAHTVAVDATEASLTEAGEIVAAIEWGLLDQARLVEIGTVAPDWVDSRPPEAITVFKSVGMAIQDVAAAELIAGRLLGGAVEGEG